MPSTPMMSMCMCALPSPAYAYLPTPPHTHSPLQVFPVSINYKFTLMPRAKW